MVVIEKELLPYFTWLLHGSEDSIGALWSFLIFVSVAGLLGLLFGFLVAAIRRGPMAAGDLTYRVMGRAAYELFAISPRRIWALTWLAVQESIRRRIFVVLGIYLLMLAMGSWFLNTELADPAQLQIDLVMTGTNFLIVLSVLFLSTFSLPNDFKNRTIYTIVTKPTYTGEIILGRIFGFILTGSALLAIMALLSYFFVVRTLNHTHTIDQQAFASATDENSAENTAENTAESTAENGDENKESKSHSDNRSGLTSKELYHRHEFVLDEEGNGIAKANKGHLHEVKDYQVGPALDMFQARVPKFGKLTFKSITGQDESRGISVGSEWDYLSYVEGGTQAAGIWTFEGIEEADYPDGLPVEMYIRVYRSYKGDINKGILGSLRVRNPVTGLQSEVIQTFYAKDFQIDEKFIPRALKGRLPGESVAQDYDLFHDFVDNGELQIEIQCLDKQQYFGLAQANLYLRENGGNFELNFIKGFIGVWTQMVLVICFGVLFSSIVSGPVALLATASCVLLGFFTTFLMDVATGRAEGGGPLESMIRTYTQTNLVVDLEQTAGVIVAETLDKVALFFMRLWFYILPNFGDYSTINWVADGFNIPGSQVGQQVTVALSYIFGVYVAGYFFLRLREVGQ